MLREVIFPDSINMLYGLLVSHGSDLMYRHLSGKSLDEPIDSLLSKCIEYDDRHGLVRVDRDFLIWHFCTSNEVLDCYDKLVSFLGKA